MIACSVPLDNGVLCTEVEIEEGGTENDERS